MWLIDPLSASTFDADTGDICCPSCGTVVDIDHVEPDPETRVGVCPYCR